MNIVMIGTGYVGLVTGLGFAKLGHRVACVDIDPMKIARLDRGEVPFFEAGLPELLAEMQEAGSVMFTTDLRQVIHDAEIVMIAVGTPSRLDGGADLSAIESAAREIGGLLDHEAVIVMKSTVPVGTNRRVIAWVRDGLRSNGRGDLESLVQIVSLPEFLAEGRALADFMQQQRIVIGADDRVAAMIVDRLHEGINAPRLHMSIESAELSKYAANAFLATKVSFINEIANLAEIVGADVRDVARAIGMDKRIGPHFLRAGIGYGGSCFPKDVQAMHQIAGANGYHFKLISAVMEVNDRQARQFFAKVKETLNGVKGRRIAVWGLAFKGDTDDVRKSVAIQIVRDLVGQGASVCAYDPRAMENARPLLSDTVEYATTPVDAAVGADALLVLTEWAEFRQVSFDALGQQMVSRIIFDGRNLLADLDLQNRGFAYYGVGIKT